MGSNYHPNIRALVERELESRGWNYHFDEESGVFSYGLNLRGKLKSIRCLVDINLRSYNVYAVSPVSANEADAEQMNRMAEFLSRANYGLRNGNFELDFRDGEIRYKSFVNCDGCEPGGEVVSDSVNCPPSMFLRYGPGILDMLFTDKTPAKAIDDCESDRENVFGDEEEEDKEDEADEANEEDEEDEEDEADEEEDGEKSAVRLLRLLEALRGKASRETQDDEEEEKEDGGLPDASDA